MNWKQTTLMFIVYSAIMFGFDYDTEDNTLEKSIVKPCVQGLIFTALMYTINYFSNKNSEK